MRNELDTTFTQCPHGSPKCESCENIRVLQWIQFNPKTVLLDKPVLVTDGDIFDVSKFTRFHEGDTGIAIIKCNLKGHATHWASLEGLAPC